MSSASAASATRRRTKLRSLGPSRAMSSVSRRSWSAVIQLAPSACLISWRRMNGANIVLAAAAGLPERGIEAVDVGLHLLAAALVHDLAAHDVADVGEAVACGRERALHAVDAFAEHDLDVVRALVEDDDVERVTGFGEDLDAFNFHAHSL